jgi:hypothetical protein
MIKPNQFQWKNVVQITPFLLAGILLVVLMAIQMNRPIATIPHLDISTVYVEYLLSFIASFVLLYWMLSPFVYDLIRGGSSSPNTIVNPRGYLIYIMFAFAAIILSPFGLLSIRFFLQDETYVKYISMTTIISTLVVLYFTFRATFP